LLWIFFKKRKKVSASPMVDEMGAHPRTTRRAAENFFDFGANASAVAADKGAAMGAQFVDGVAVFVRPLGGAMAEASVGGQQITYLLK
jgi:hypothetical protein